MQVSLRPYQELLLTFLGMAIVGVVLIAAVQQLPPTYGNAQQDKFVTVGQERVVTIQGTHRTLMEIESQSAMDDMATLVLRFPYPGEKGTSYREQLQYSGDLLTQNGITYTRTKGFIGAYRSIVGLRYVAHVR